jgi:hypothetical protein
MSRTALRTSLITLGLVVVLALTLYALGHGVLGGTSRMPAASSCVIDGVYHLPNPAWTPGKLCSKDDRDYDGERYSERIPHCRRNVSKETKVRVARRYGVDPADLSHYEIDHFIELNAGGSNDESNLWPQPFGPNDAAAKDRVEDETYHGLRDGTMTQDEAVAEIRAWRPGVCPP